MAHLTGSKDVQDAAKREAAWASMAVCQQASRTRDKRGKAAAEQLTILQCIPLKFAHNRGQAAYL